MNRIVLTGRLGEDPACGITNTGIEYATMRIAVSREIPKDKIKEDTVTVDWFKCTIFGQRVTSFVKPYLKKGDKILIEGNIRFEYYTNKDGQNVLSPEVIINSFESLNYKGKDKVDEITEVNTSSNTNNGVLTPIQDEDLPF